MMSTTDEDAYRHFKETLEADLRQNIKPVIISLTMLAEDYKQSSQVIAKSIEEYIIHVPADIKILGLYLMDSIMKNLKYTTNYTTIFEKSMVNLFIRVFECVDEEKRKALYKLRQTWNDVFSNRLLYDIDVSVKRIDPAWPITANLSLSRPATQQTSLTINGDTSYSNTNSNNSNSTSSSSSRSAKPSPSNNNNNNKSILINQTNLLSSPTSQTNLGIQQTTVSQHQVTSLSMKKSSSNNNIHSSVVTNLNGSNFPTSTSFTANLNASVKAISISQEPKQQSNLQQQQQQARTSPIHVNKDYSNTTGVKKVLEFNNLKKSNTFSDSIELSLADQVIRDPRLIQRKNKASCPTQSQKSQDHQMDASNCTLLNTSPSNKKKQQQQQQNINNDKLNPTNTLKRSSPSNSSIQNSSEIKKPKLTSPVNGENKISPNKAHTSLPSKSQTSTAKLTPSPPSTKNQAQNVTANNKLSKTTLITEENKSTKISSKSDSVLGNKTFVTSNKTQPTKPVQASEVNNLETTTVVKIKQSAQKSIPSLFDIQPTPNLSNNSQQQIGQTTSTSLKKQVNPSNVDGKQKQTFNKLNTTANVNLTKSKQNQQPPNNQQQPQMSKQPLTKSNVKKQPQSDANKVENKPQKKLNKPDTNQTRPEDNDGDVDERFLNTNNSNKTKLDDVTQQLRKLTDLIAPNTVNTTPAPLTTSNPVVTPSNPKVNTDLLANLFDSNNKISLEPSVLALITAQKQQKQQPQQQQQQQQPQMQTQPPPSNTQAPPNPIDTLANNKQSLNELERRLIISKRNDQANNETQSSPNTQELIEMIRTLIKQQQLLLEQQNRKENPKSVESPFAYVDESQPMENSEVVQAEEEEIAEENNNFENHQEQEQCHQQSYYDQMVSYEDLPPIKPRDKNENLNDSLLIIDGRSYRIQPEVRRLIKVYYHDHELFCDTRTKEVFVDQKRVYKMGEPTKEIMLNGRRVRLMYMGKRIEIWIDGLSYHFRADSPPKQISVTSSNNQIKRYYVTIDSRTMDMFFDNYKVCQINSGTNKLMVQLAPNDFEPHEISFVCPPKRIMIDGVPRTMRYDLPVPCIEMSEGLYYVIRFSGKPREIYIDDMPYLVAFDKTIRIKLNGRAHELAWGGPGFEVIIDGRPYELQFNKPSREIIIGTRPHFIYICGDAPDVKICGQLPYELLNQQKQESENIEEMETDHNKIIKSLPSLMQPLQTNNFMLSSNQQTTQPNSINQQQTNKQPDIQELIKSLVDHKLIKPVAKEPKLSTPLDAFVKNMVLPKNQTNNEKDNEKEIEKLPDLTNFEVDLLKKTYPGAIQSLYSGHQCATCGNRFNQADLSSGTSNSRYRKHLDWHFRQNRREKDEINKAHSRSWYYILQDWIQYEELSEDSANNSGNDGNERQPGSNGMDTNNEDGNDLFNDNNGLSKNSMNAFNTGTTCPATDDIDDKCYVCQDPFEIFFHEEKDEWHFKDAIRVDNRIYHPICFEDAREDMSINRSSHDESMLMESRSVTNIKNEPSNSHINDQIMRSQSDETSTDNSIEMTTSLMSRKDDRLKNEPKTP